MFDSSFEFLATGTKWRVDLLLLLEQDLAQIEALVKQRVSDFEKIYSRFREDSLVAKMAATQGEFVLAEDSQELLDFYFDLNSKTKGLFTPLIGEMLNTAGYDREYSLKQKSGLTKPPELWEVLYYRFPLLKTSKAVQLDFGAAGKGYIIDIVGRLLEDMGIENYCVDAGGDIRYRNNQSRVLRIGLENPKNPEQVIGVVSLASNSFCGSSGNRRQWGKYHHIMNPKTLDSPTEVVATWVMAETTMLADGLATCLFFTSGKELRKSYGFEYLVLYQDFSIEKSPLFPVELF